MRELLRTNDVVKDAGIEAFVLDRHTSILEGSIGALPRRLMVSDVDAMRARDVLGEANITLPEPPPA
jgi:hypothetical protein